MAEIWIAGLLGIGAGQAIAYNICSVPIILEAKDPKQKAHLWQVGFKRGMGAAVATTLAYLPLALPSLIQGASFNQLMTCGLLLVKYPFTLVFMMPTNNQLLDSKTPDDKIEGLVVRWKWLHWVRCVTETLAFAFCLRGLVGLS
jgi:hypothetical protein